MGSDELNRGWWLVRLGVVALSIWAAWAFASELQRSRQQLHLPDTPPSLWRFDGPAVAALQDDLLRVDQRVPRGAVIAIEATELSAPELFFLTMWCSYFLPHHDVVRPHVRTTGPRYVWSYPAAALRLDTNRAGNTEAGEE